MKKDSKVEEFFASSNAFTAFSFLTIMGFFVWGLCLFVTKQYSGLIMAIFFAIISTGLFAGYKSGETNVQKALTGALLSMLVVSNTQLFASVVADGNAIAALLQAVIVFLYIVIFITHIVLQSDHAGNKNVMTAGYVIALLQLLLHIVVEFLRVSVIPEIELIDIISSVSAAVSSVLVISMLLCIETRIYLYRVKRAEGIKNGTWDAASKADAKKLFIIE